MRKGRKVVSLLLFAISLLILYGIFSFREFETAWYLKYLQKKTLQIEPGMTRHEAEKILVGMDIPLSTKINRTLGGRMRVPGGWIGDQCLSHCEEGKECNYTVRYYGQWYDVRNVRIEITYEGWSKAASQSCRNEDIIIPYGYESYARDARYDWTKDRVVGPVLIKDDSSGFHGLYNVK